MTPISARIRLAILAGAASLPFGVVRSAAAQQTVRYRLGHPLTTGDAAHTAMVSLADNLKKRTNGAIEITVFPADQLGRQRDVGEMVRQGAAVIQLTDALFLGEWVPDAAILQAPYLMDTPQDFRKLLGTPWLESVNNRLAQRNVRVLSWNNYFGTRQILAKRAIRTPAEMGGLNFRCAAAPMYVEMVKAMGARPVTTGFAEVYTGLAQGTLDMLEAPLPTMWASKFYEQAKFAMLTGHMIAWDPVITSETSFKALPADLQKIMLEEASNAAELMTRLKLAEEAEILPKYEQAGVTIVRDVDRAAFRRATEVVYDRYEGWSPNLRATVRNLITS